MADFPLHRMNTEREAENCMDHGEVTYLSDQPVERLALEVLEGLEARADDGP